MGTYTQAGCCHSLMILSMMSNEHGLLEISQATQCSETLAVAQEYAQLWSQTDCNNVNAYDGWINDRMQCAGNTLTQPSQKSAIPFGGIREASQKKDFVLNYGLVGVKSPKLSVTFWIYMFVLHLE